MHRVVLAACPVREAFTSTRAPGGEIGRQGFGSFSFERRHMQVFGIISEQRKGTSSITSLVSSGTRSGVGSL